ncbi:hypothetical protein KIN20_032819 [Parelaphostrongylus tenuis]|uniref:Uncharacterized protein n=1 Tax=Parelaphostrongylus tenuis TaxID=148309 RepID=A0AAD5R7L2_PARTN|nr:hypothetical protein KIN20_032819 [Parelaphostrongylus tenuis]
METDISTAQDGCEISTDAVCMLNAIPTRGVLHIGEQQPIVFFMFHDERTQGLGRRAKAHSHIAIDYVFAEPSASYFDKTVFGLVENKRHVLQAVFDY